MMLFSPGVNAAATANGRKAAAMGSTANLQSRSYLTLGARRWQVATASGGAPVNGRQGPIPVSPIVKSLNGRCLSEPSSR